MTDDIVEWSCKQIPNGMNPIVVCERQDLLDEIERLRCDLLMKNRRIDELAAEIDGYKEWIASKGFDWEEADRG